LFIGLIIPNYNSMIVKDIFKTFNQSFVSLISDFVFGHCQKMCFIVSLLVLQKSHKSEFTFISFRKELVARIL